MQTTHREHKIDTSLNRASQQFRLYRRFFSLSTDLSYETRRGLAAFLFFFHPISAYVLPFHFDPIFRPGCHARPLFLAHFSRSTLQVKRTHSYRNSKAIHNNHRIEMHLPHPSSLKGKTFGLVQTLFRQHI